MRIIYPALAALLVSGPAFAQSTESPMPPPDGMKLSEIIGKIEQRDHFQYIKEVEWESAGYYEVTYYTTDKAKVEIKIDPATGQPR